MSKIIHAISGPRNISTALMYSFAQRPGCAVIDEPMYGVYLKKWDPDHPGKEATLSQWPTSIAGVRARVESLSEHDEIYLKNMAHHMRGEPWHWVDPWAYVFWIRHPRKVVHSFTRVIERITPVDIGLKEQWEQWEQLNQSFNFSGSKIIVDSDEMLSSPAKNMAVICEALGIPPREEMLSWKAGQKPYDGPWWPHWYTKVHKSVGFGPAKAMPKMLRTDHEAVVQATLPAYEALHEQRLRFV